MNLLAQFFGVLALCTVVITMQIKERNKSLIFMIFVNLFFSINFLLLNAYSGAIICFLAVMQAIVFYIHNKKEKEVPKYIIALFILCILLTGVFTYSNIYSVFPVIGGTFSMFSMLTKNMKAFRTLTFIICILWITYDIISGAYAALVTHIINLISVIVAIIRYDIRKPKKIS
ncbi:MAG: YgjV family protein [Firmicutes bacterium]|nr:YgjV family protein [Bacillota bacterium]